MIAMGKSRNKKPPAPDEKPRNLNVWVHPDLRAGIEKSSKRNRRTLTAEVEIALEQYLAANGLWPPSQD